MVVFLAGEKEKRASNRWLAENQNMVIQEKMQKRKKGEHTNWENHKIQFKKKPGRSEVHFKKKKKGNNGYSFQLLVKINRGYR